jgi:hypothetical protein
MSEPEWDLSTVPDAVLELAMKRIKLEEQKRECLEQGIQWKVDQLAIEIEGLNALLEMWEEGLITIGEEPTKEEGGGE